MSILNVIERAINEKMLRTGAMGTESVDIELELTEEQKQEFLNIDLDEHYAFEFLENGNLSITYEEDLDSYDLDKIIEHLQETGKVVINDIKETSKLKERLNGKGYNTYFESTDREYLVWEEYNEVEEEV